MELEQQNASDVFGVSQTVSVLGRTISDKRAGNFDWLSPSLVAGNCEISPGHFVTGVYDGAALTELHWRAGNDFVCGGQRFATWANDGIGVLDSVLGSFPSAALGAISPEGDLVIVPNGQAPQDLFLYRAGNLDRNAPAVIPTGQLSFTRTGKGYVCMRGGVILWSENGRVFSWGAEKPITGGISIRDPRFCQRMSDGQRFILYIDGTGLSVIEWHASGTARGWRVGPHTGHDFRPDIAPAHNFANGLIIGSGFNEGEVRTDRQIYLLDTEENRWKLNGGPWIASETFQVSESITFPPIDCHVGAFCVTNTQADRGDWDAPGTLEVLHDRALLSEQVGSRPILVTMDCLEVQTIPRDRILGLYLAWIEGGNSNPAGIEAGYQKALELNTACVLYSDTANYPADAATYALPRGILPMVRCYPERDGAETIDELIARVTSNTGDLISRGFRFITWAMPFYLQVKGDGTPNWPEPYVLEIERRLIALRSWRYATTVQLLGCFAYSRGRNVDPLPSTPRDGIMAWPNIKQQYDALCSAVRNTPALPPVKRLTTMNKAEITVERWNLDRLEIGREFNFFDRQNPQLGTRVRVWIEATPTGPSMRAEIDYPGAGTDLAGRTGAPRIVKVCPTT